LQVWEQLTRVIRPTRRIRFAMDQREGCRDRDRARERSVASGITNTIFNDRFEFVSSPAWIQDRFEILNKQSSSCHPVGFSLQRSRCRKGWWHRSLVACPRGHPLRTIGWRAMDLGTCFSECAVFDTNTMCGGPKHRTPATFGSSSRR